MARYIAVDNCSGYIWGDSADLNGHIFTGTPLEFSAALDAAIGTPWDRTYEETSRYALASNETGYHIYRADVNGSEAVAVINDGQDQEMIEAVMRDCEYITTIRCVDADTA
jgi:hypothetical protein